MTIDDAAKELIRRRANYLCEYCHSPERISATRFTIDHIIPRSVGGSNETDNLALACRRCNERRYNYMAGFDRETQAVVPLFNPLKIGIAHLESSLPDSADISDKSVASELREQIQGLDARLRAIEGKLSDNITDDTSDTVDESIQGVSRATLAPIFEEVDNESDERGLSDRELGEVLGVSNLLIRDYRVKGKKPPAGLMRKLKEWEVRCEEWVRKN